MFNLKKLNDVAAKEQYQLEIVNKFVTLENVYENALGKVLETI
jgi:hypothetical protein